MQRMFGDMDAVCYHDNKIAWYQNDGNKVSRSRLSQPMQMGLILFIIDVDGDGDMDVLSASIEIRLPGRAGRKSCFRTSNERRTANCC